MGSGVAPGRLYLPRAIPDMSCFQWGLIARRQQSLLSMTGSLSWTHRSYPWQSSQIHPGWIEYCNGMVSQGLGIGMQPGSTSFLRYWNGKYGGGTVPVIQNYASRNKSKCMNQLVELYLRIADDTDDTRRYRSFTNNHCNRQEDQNTRQSYIHSEARLLATHLVCMPRIYLKSSQFLTISQQSPSIHIDTPLFEHLCFTRHHAPPSAPSSNISCDKPKNTSAITTCRSCSSSVFDGLLCRGDEILTPAHTPQPLYQVQICRKSACEKKRTED
jgi:hypothetical protein